MKRRTPLRRKTRLNPVSAKRAVQNEEYLKLRELYLYFDHPICERCNTAPAVDIHHKAGRVGELLCNPAYFMAVCRQCHDAIHANMKEAEEAGFIVRLR